MNEVRRARSGIVAHGGRAWLSPVPGQGRAASTWQWLEALPDPR